MQGKLLALADARHLGTSLAGALLAATAACGGGGEPPPLFELLDPATTGVTFVNAVPEDTAFNILNYLYYYNGGGVAAGDVNGDGLPDLYFTANRGKNRLYLNRGNYRFEDATERAGVGGVPGGWSSGVTMADVNGDGHLDIYVCGISYLSIHGRNVLYLNRGDGTFTDATERVGLSHVGYSTQALFFDYDRDGDLDMYLLNASVHSERAPSSRPQRSPRHPRAGDRLFRNEGRGERFADVSDAAGIHGGVEGYGLGVVASDFDGDGCLDLYVANDFQENDFLYHNNCDGTFTESVERALPHTSQFAMGVDAADFNNDGLTDIAVVDMMPAREDVLKSAAGADNRRLMQARLRAGYHAQVARNTLQLNRGDGRFSDIAFLAGVHATDWSWAPLFADLDNDGWKDLFITNGVYRRPNDLDYIRHVSSPAVQAALARGTITRSDLALVSRMPRVPVENFAFRNNGDLTFANHAAAWGLGQPGFSNGAVYVDLDNKGALDLVVNNVNAPASIYRNRAREVGQRHYLRVELRGSDGNTAGIGARVTISHGSATQTLEQVPTRGFQSSVDPRLHFGLGEARRVDSVRVRWPDGRSQLLANVPADTAITLAQRDARVPDRTAPVPAAPLFENVTAAAGITARHRENDPLDFEREPLIPRVVSTEGPALAVGDVNGDALDDIYLGGGKWQGGRLLVQGADGRFTDRPVPAFAADSLAEDVDAELFDADGDGDLDLYVVSGGNEFRGGHPALRDRLYVNDGQGGFTRSVDAIPDIAENGGCVAAGDFNGDGRPDLFVGGRVIPGQYGMAPRSVLLENVGNGKFRDVTGERAPGLDRVGMVTDAAWLGGPAERDGGAALLVVVGDWMPVRVFEYANGTFRERSADLGLAGSAGWWNSVTPADLDGDGRTDLVLGNWGLNSYIKASPPEPARLYVHDFGGNGSLEQVLTFFRNGVSHPIAGRDELLGQVPSLRVRYPTYASFGAARLEDLFAASELRAARRLEVQALASAVAYRTPDGRFQLAQLPVEAQLAPVFASLVADVDGDGSADILLGGNFAGASPLRGPYDASDAQLLRGDGNGRFIPLGPGGSGLAISGEIRGLAIVRGRLGMSVAVARNNDTLQLWRARRASASSRLSLPYPTSEQRGRR